MSRLILRYTVSWLLIVAILLACFLPVPETEMDDVPFIDKWVHVGFQGYSQLFHLALSYRL